MKIKMILGFGLVLGGQLFASTLTVSTGSGAIAKAGQAAFLAGKTSVMTETFEGFAVGNGKGNGYYADPIATSVGTFTQIVDGFGGACAPCNKLAVLDSDTTPFTGRYNMTTGGKNWLDSNDSASMLLSFGPLAPVFNLGFFLMDPNDAGGRLSINFNNAGIQNFNLPSAVGNGRAYYIAIEGTDAINSITFNVNKPNGQPFAYADGYGIDDVSIASTETPEPGTYAMLGTGLVGLVYWRRRKEA